MSTSESLRQIFNRCALGIDEDDFQLFGSCFNENASFSTASQPCIEGREAICDYFRARRQARRERGEQSRHLITNVVVLDETEASALAVAYVTGLVAAVDHTVSFHFGWYRDRFVYDDGRGWLIAEHFIHADGSDAPAEIAPGGFQFVGLKFPGRGAS